MKNKTEHNEHYIEFAPKWKAFAKEQIESAGYEIVKETELYIKFCFKGRMIVMYPYSGFYFGSNITNGRGIKSLMEKIKK